MPCLLLKQLPAALAAGAFIFTASLCCLPWHNRAAAKPASGKGTQVRFPDTPVGFVDIVKARPYEFQRKEFAVSPTMPAAGVITVPPGCAMNIKLNYQGSRNTSFLLSLPPNLVRKVGCSRLELTDKEVENIGHMTDLQELNLESTDLTDKGAKHLGNLTNLRVLNVGDTLLTANGAACLAKMKKLDRLTLSRMKLGDDIGPRLTPLTSVTVLDLCGIQISDRTVKQLSSLAALRELTLARNNITDRAIPALLNLKNLTHLNLVDTRMTVEGMQKLAQLPKLKVLTLRTNRFETQGLARLKTVLPRVKIANVANGGEKFDPELWEPLH